MSKNSSNIFSKSVSNPKLNKIKIAVIKSSFNEKITNGLLNGALKYFKSCSININNIEIFTVPGAFEIPFIAKQLCNNKKYDGILCLGAVIKGETAHFEYISQSAAYGIMKLNLISSIPVSFGILTCYNTKQAISRSSDNSNNKGTEAACALIETIQLNLQIK